MLLALISTLVKPGNSGVLPLFGLIFPYTFIISCFLVLIVIRYSRIIGLLALICMAVNIKSFAAYVRPTLISPSQEGNLHVLTFNVMMGSRMVNDKYLFGEAEQKVFTELIQRGPLPHIICAQEANQLSKQAFKKAFGESYFHEEEGRGAIIISKFPIVDKGYVDFGRRLNSCLWADVAINTKDTVRIYSAHLESNRLRQSTYEFVNGHNYYADDAVEGIKEFVSNFPKYAGKRADQALDIKMHMAESPYPVILCGDFNDPPMSFTYRTMKSGLNDTFLDSGSGFGTTWIGAIPMLRIDYIFASKELKNTAYYCLESDLSDHHPIKASFYLDE